MKEIIVYTMDSCSFCERAKQLLTARGFEYTENRVDYEDEATWAKLEAETGMKTMPQIFIDGKCVGGYTELAELDSNGELANLVGTNPT